MPRVLWPGAQLAGVLPVVTRLAGDLQNPPVFDSTLEYVSSQPVQVTPRADMPDPWYVTNLGPGTLYAGPPGVTPDAGTPIPPGSQYGPVSRDLPYSTFVVTAPGESAALQVTCGS